MASLELKGIHKVYDSGVEAVKDFNMEIADKDFIILLGPSGCGKTTTLRMIAGLEEITSGELYIGDTLVNNITAKDRDIAMVFQNYALYPHMTVYDNMAFGLKLRKIPKDEIQRRVESAAEILDIKHLLDRKPKALSGGQRQRVALGRAIVREPKVFLMDEPLSNLDAKLRAQMRTEINKLHKRLQTTFIYVTHDQTEAMTMGTKIVCMKDGIVQQIADPQTLYENPVNMFVAGFIGSPQMNFVNAVLDKKEDGYYISFGNTTLKLPEGKAKLLEGKGYEGKEVVFGIRPENIHDEQVYVTTFAESTVQADVIVTEAMGAETFLYLKIDGIDFTARVNPRTKAKPGESLTVAFELEKMHLFDKETEETII